MANAHHGRAEIGYWVVASARGRGVAAEAVALVGDWAFANLHLHRLGLYIEPWNLASIRTAERAGYEREVLLRRWQVVAGEPKDMWSYARLRPVGAQRMASPK
jgi:RimJ/RimL family protein N-acetyltransferase